MAEMPVTSVCSRSLASLVSQIHQVCINFIKIHNQTLIYDEAHMRSECAAAFRSLVISRLLPSRQQQGTPTMDDENLGMLYFCLLKNDIAVDCHRCRSVVSLHISRQF